MDFLSPSTSSLGAPAAQPYMSADELMDELVLNKTLLASLDDNDAHYEDTAAGIKSEIARLKERLEVIRSKTKKPSAINGFRTTSPHSRQAFGSPAPGLSTSRSTSGLSSNLSPTIRRKPSTDGQSSKQSNMNDPFQDDPDRTMGGVLSTPFGANSTQANPELRNKRSHSYALSGLKEEERESKSRRTSPTDTPTDEKKKTYNVDNQGFIDLISDDEEDQLGIQNHIERQRKQHANLEKKAERTKRDREMAEQLARQNGYGASGSSGSGPAIPSAFERMMGMRGSSQAEGSSATPGGRPAPIVLGDSDDSELEVIPPTQFSPNEMRRTSMFPTSSPMIPSSPAFANSSNPFAPGASRIPFTAQSTGVAAAAPAASSQPPSHFRPYVPFQTSGPVKTETGLFANPSYTTNGPPSSLSGMHAGSPIFTGPEYATQMPGPSSSSLANVVSSLPGMGYPGSLTNRAAVSDSLSNAIMNTSAYSQSLQNDILDYVNDPRKTAGEIKALIENISPDMEIPKEDREGTPEGLKYPLYAHQQISLMWMKKQEENEATKGGLLADDMGLGKTISTLALILSRRRPPTHRKKTTLIVAPVALLRQWDSEIQNKVKNSHKLSVFTYHSGKKATFEQLRMYDIVLTTYGTLGAEYTRCEKHQARKQMHPDIDLTRNEFQKVLPFLGIKSNWYRVILDEAQNVKNKNTKAAMGALHLKADYRWCLTGTPMMNGTHELYSLIRFLRIRPYNDQSAFNQAFGVLTKGTGPKAQLERSMRKLQALLKAIMLRRTKTSTIDGKPILTLPEKTEEVVHAIFDKDQQDYYTSLETKSKAQFNKYHKAGTIGKNYSSILLLLLRLRQAACHPHLIMDLEAAPGEASTEVMVDLAKKLPDNVVARLKAAPVPFECPVCYDALLNPTFTLNCCHHACTECLTKITSEIDPNAENGEDVQGNARCPTCRAPISINRIIDYTSFRIAHMGYVDPSTKVEDDDDDSDSDSDSDSMSDVDESDIDDNGNIRNFIVPDDEDETEESSDEEDDDLDAKPVAKPIFKPEFRVDSDDEDIKPRSRSRVKREAAVKSENGKDTNIFDFDEEDYLPEPAELQQRILAAKKAEPSDEKVWSDPDKPKKRFSNKKAKKAKKGKKSKKDQSERKNKGPKEDYKAPAKHLNLAQLKKDSRKNNEARRRYMRYLKKNWVTSAKIDKLMEILRDTPYETKTIVFSQFTTLLDLCEVPLREEKFGIGRFDGGMSAEHRYQAVEEFTKDPKQRVLLVSLKAGNAGLNLVAASQVIILDPFWNPFVEMQAVDRAHRIGQQKPVTVHRILVEGTVEDRIIDLQNRKKKLVDAALDEKASAGISRLGQAELVYLFNNDDAGLRQTMVRPPVPPIPRPSMAPPGSGPADAYAPGSGAGSAYSLPPLGSLPTQHTAPVPAPRRYMSDAATGISFGNSSQTLAPMGSYATGYGSQRPTLPSFQGSAFNAPPMPGSYPSPTTEQDKKEFMSPTAASAGFNVPSSSLGREEIARSSVTPKKFNSSFMN